VVSSQLPAKDAPPTGEGKDNNRRGEDNSKGEGEARLLEV
jgi:hypothetical protein